MLWVNHSPSHNKIYPFHIYKTVPCCRPPPSDRWHLQPHNHRRSQRSRRLWTRRHCWWWTSTHISWRMSHTPHQWSRILVRLNNLSMCTVYAYVSWHACIYHCRYPVEINIQITLRKKWVKYSVFSFCRQLMVHIVATSQDLLYYFLNIFKTSKHFLLKTSTYLSPILTIMYHSFLHFAPLVEMNTFKLKKNFMKIYFFEISYSLYSTYGSSRWKKLPATPVHRVFTKLRYFHPIFNMFISFIQNAPNTLFSQNTTICIYVSIMESI